MFNTRFAFPPQRTSGLCTAIGLCAAAALMTHAAHAQHPNFPEGHNVTFGDATVNPPGVNWQEINLHAPASVIEWLHFSIGTGNTVEFLGANNAAVLNYVNNVNANPSNILGHILAPDISVYLVNPAGIVFGQNSTVNAGQFIAAASVLNNPEDFFLSNPQFDSVYAAVVNRGVIQAKNAVHLIGTQVRNRGVINITNPDGFITLTAYNNGSVTLSPFGDRYHVTLAGGNDTNIPDTGVINSGVLNAPGGTIQLGAGDLYSVAINLDNTDGDFSMSSKHVHLGSDPSAGAWNTAGHMELSSNITIDADLANFWGTVDSETGESHDLIIGNAGGTLNGNANFHAAVGSGQALGNLSVQGDAVAGSTIVTDENVDIAGSATFNDDVTADGSIRVGQSVTIANTLALDAGNLIELGYAGTFNTVGLTGNEDLTLTSGNGSSVSGALRNLTNVAVNNGDLTAGNINLFGSLMSSSASVNSDAGILATSMDINGNLTAAGSIIATAGDIDVTGLIQSGTAIATGDIIAGWATIFGSTFAGGSITTTNNAETSIFSGNVIADTGSIDIAGNAGFGGNVLAAQNITFGGMSTFAGAGDQFVQATGGSINAFGMMHSIVSGDLHLFAHDEVNLADVIVSGGGSLDITGLLTASSLLAHQNITVHSDGGAVQNVSGNMTAVGGSISVLDNFSVGGDVVAGENVTFGNNGRVIGRVEGIDGNVTFGHDAEIGDDADPTGIDVTAGQYVTFGNNATVWGSIAGNLGVTAGNNALVGGGVESLLGDISFGANSEIQGDVTAGSPIVAAGVGNLIFGDGAIFGGNIVAGDNITLLGSATFNGGATQTAHAFKGELFAGGLLSSTNAGDLILRAGTQVNLTDGAQVTSAGDSLHVHGSLLSGGSIFADDDVIIFNDSVITGNVTAQNGTASFGSLSPFDSSSITGSVNAGVDVVFWNDATVTGNVTADTQDVVFLRTANVGGNVEAGRNAAFNMHATLGGNVLAGLHVGFGADGAEFVGADQEVIAMAGGIEALGHLHKSSPGNLMLDGATSVWLGEGAAVQVGHLHIHGSLTSLDDLSAGQSVVVFDDSFIDGNVLAGLDAQFMDDAEVTGGVKADIRDVVFLGTAIVGGDVEAGRNVAFNQHATLGGNVLGMLHVGFGADGASFVGADQSVNAQMGELFSAGELIKKTDGAWSLRGRDVLLLDRVIHDALGDLDIHGPVTIVLFGDVDVRDGSMTIHDDFTTHADLLASEDITLLGAGEFAGAGVDQLVSAGGTLHAHETLTSTEAGDLTLRGLVAILLDDTVDVQDGSLVIENDFITLADLLASQNITLMGAGEFTGAGVDQHVQAGGTLHAMSTLTSTAAGDLTLGGASHIQLDDTVDVQDGSLTIEDAFTTLADLLASQDITLIGAGEFVGAGIDQTVDADGTLHAMSTLKSTAAGDLTLRGASHIQLDGTVDVQDGSLTIEDAFTALAHLLASENITLMSAGELAGAGLQRIRAQNGTLLVMDELTKTSDGALTLGGGSGIVLEDIVRVLGLGGHLYVADNVEINGGAVLSTGNQKYRGMVILGDDTQLLSGKAVTFEQTVDSDALGTWALAIGKFVDQFGHAFGGNAVILGDVGGGADGLLQEFTVAGNADVAADIAVANGIRFDGKVELLDDSTMIAGGPDGVTFGSAVDGPHVLTVQTAEGDISFHGQIGGGPNTPLAGLILNALDPDGAIILFDTDLVHVIGDILLNVGNPLPTIIDGQTPLAQIAGTGNLVILAEGGTFEMGQNQKLSTLGSLFIGADVAVLGDLNTLGDMAVDANQIIILLRPMVDDFDMGVDFVAGGLIFFSVVPETQGTGLPPQFANPDGNADALGTLQTFLIRAFGDGPAMSELRSGGTYFDVAARGPVTTDLSTALAGETPDGDTEETDTETALPGEAIQALLDRGFLVRVLDPAEVVGMVDGRGIYVDGRNVVDDETPMIEGVALSGGAPMDISLVRGLEGLPHDEAIRRLRTQPVVAMQRVSGGMLGRVLDSHDKLYLQEDPVTGEPIPGPREIELAIDVTWEEFKADHPEARPREFSQFLRQFMAQAPSDEDREDAALVLHFMGMMRELQDGLHVFGMSRGEANRMVVLKLRDFLPQDVPATHFLQALQGLDD